MQSNKIKNFTLDWETGRYQIELDIKKELNLDEESVGPYEHEVSIHVNCTDNLTGEIQRYFERLKIYRSINPVLLSSVDFYHGSNGSDFDSVVLTIKVGRRDDKYAGGPLSGKVELS